MITTPSASNNKTGTSNVEAIFKAQKVQTFRGQKVQSSICSSFLRKTRKEGLKHPQGAFRTRKTLQKLRYSVLGHMGAIFPNLGFLSSKEQFTLDITSKIRIVLNKLLENIY